MYAYYDSHFLVSIQLSGQKIQTSIERMFRIWKDRKVYNSQFLRELETLIEPTKAPAAPVVELPPPPDFKVCVCACVSIRV